MITCIIGDARSLHLRLPLPAYDHDDPRRCFQPLMLALRAGLSSVLEQNAIQIELQERQYGVRVMSASYMRENRASILTKAVLTILRMGRRGCEAGTKSSSLRTENRLSVKVSAPRMGVRVK